MVTTGPITVPIFLMYGLVKGAFLATEAAGSLAIYVAKVLAFRGFGAMPWEIFVKGLITGSSLMAGTFIAKRFVMKLDAESFRYMLDGLMLSFRPRHALERILLMTLADHGHLPSAARRSNTA